MTPGREPCKSQTVTMTTKTDVPELELKLQDFCDRIGASYRDARYALAHGMVPTGIDREPGRGKHRVFDDRQAFWLAIVLKCKAAGIKPKLATEIANWSRRVSGYAQNLGWDWQFSPFLGNFATDKQWYLDVGDARFVRIVTDASPGNRGLRDESEWVNMKTRKLQPDAEPTVVVRIDLSRLAAQLQGVS